MWQLTEPTVLWVQVEFMELCQGANFVVQMWSHVVGLYDYTLLLEYCPFNSLQHLLDVRAQCTVTQLPAACTAEHSQAGSALIACLCGVVRSLDASEVAHALRPQYLLRCP